MVSCIIPSKNEPYLFKTIQDILIKATGKIEVIAILDGWWPKAEEIIDDPRVKYFHQEQKGMRSSINSGVAISRGDYILKCDAHVMFEKKFDEVLTKDCKENWIIVPRRYPLDPVNWQIEKRSDSKYPIDYMVLKDFHAIPYYKEGLQIDDLMTSQGSCWFMPRKYYDELELLDEDTYGTFFNEFQEIGLKCWLSGGEIKINKNTWYAHWHKTEGRGYSMPDTNEKALQALEKWKTKGWHKQTKPLSWLFEKFKI
jgi:glycosyltransferase involved in cell wall biosynthesis